MLTHQHDQTVLNTGGSSAKASPLFIFGTLGGVEHSEELYEFSKLIDIKKAHISVSL